MCARSLSRVPLFATTWTEVSQAPLSMEFSRQGYWSGLPCPPPGDLLDLGIKLHLLHFLQWQADSLPLVPPRKYKCTETHATVAQGAWTYSPVVHLSGPLGYKLLVGKVCMLFMFLCPVCVSLAMSRRQHHMSSKWSRAQHSNKQIVTGNKQIDITQAHVHRGTFWPRVECFKCRVPFHLLWSHGWMRASLKACSTFSIYVLFGDPWVWNCTLKPGAKESSHT